MQRLGRGQVQALVVGRSLYSGGTVSPALADGSPPGSPTDKGVVGLRAAALAWAHAVFTGTVADIKGMEGSQCRSGPRYSPTILNEYLKGMRLELQHTLGIPSVDSNHRSPTRYDGDHRGR